MKKFPFQSGTLLLLVALMSTGPALPSDSDSDSDDDSVKQIRVNCDHDDSIQDALDRATEGATIDVYGTCNESVVIQTDRIRIGAFFGQTTFINPPAGSVAFTVLADRVEISNLNITGGTSAVDITKGSSAAITNNHIFDSTERAFFISSSSYGEISSNDLHSTIIGDPNLSQIFVAGNAAADILNNTINTSSGNGILVVSTSSAVINDNNLSASSGVGMFVGSNSSIALLAPNTVSGGASIVCGDSGSLFVGAVQTITAGIVIVNAGCDLNNDVMDPSFPP